MGSMVEVEESFGECLKEGMCLEKSGLCLAFKIEGEWGQFK